MTRQHLPAVRYFHGYSEEDQGLLAAIAGSLARLLERAPVLTWAFRTPEHHAQTPILAGRHRLERQLGWGGVETEYEALDTELERRVAERTSDLVKANTILKTRLPNGFDMGSVSIHYFIASASGDSAVVEFFKGRMVVLRNEAPWQVATNFLLASTNENVQGQCWRYDLIEQRLKELEGRISSKDAFHLLEDVSQENTQWTIVYYMTSGDLDVVMGRDYSGKPHTFHLKQTTR